MSSKWRKSAFMTFAFEWKAKQCKPTMSLDQTIKEAGKIWQNMSQTERAPYLEKVGKGKNREKYTCTRVPLSRIEQEKKDAEHRELMMKRDIETCVRNSIKCEMLAEKSYFFIMVNYFTKVVGKNIYVPAEISFAEYSLKNGIIRTYHTFINPGITIYGNSYEAQEHCKNTHKLPLPPRAMGTKNMAIVFNDLLDFIKDENTDNYSPVYTISDNIKIVESVLDFLKTDFGAKSVSLKIYPIQYLFFVLKEATCEQGERSKPPNHFLTDAIFERDIFEYQSEIACQYHEDIDSNKYCTQSYVIRWGYTFSEYMLADIAISPIPGRHLPLKKSVHYKMTSNSFSTQRNEKLAMTTPAIETECNIDLYWKNEKKPAIDFEKCT